MCVYIHMCVCVCLCVCVCVCVYTYTHIHIHVYVCSFAGCVAAHSVCMCVHECVSAAGRAPSESGQGGGKPGDTYLAVAREQREEVRHHWCHCSPPLSPPLSVSCSSA